MPLPSGPWEVGAAAVGGAGAGSLAEVWLRPEHATTVLNAAAATLTAVPRSMAAALPPLIVGMMLDRSVFGWPLVCGGVVKAIYDVLLLVQLRNVPSHEAT